MFKRCDLDLDFVVVCTEKKQVILSYEESVRTISFSCMCVVVKAKLKIAGWWQLNDKLINYDTKMDTNSLQIHSLLPRVKF